MAKNERRIAATHHNTTYITQTEYKPLSNTISLTIFHNPIQYSQVYLDSFLKLAKFENCDDDNVQIKNYVKQLNYANNLHNVDLIICKSKELEDLDPEIRQYSVMEF